MEPGTLLGIGNPLLDLTVFGDKKLLRKYKLQPDNAVIAGEAQKDLYKDLMQNYSVQFLAGGSVQNSLRVCQWLLREPKVCVFMGAVGRDTYSKILEKTAQDDGVEVKYQYHNDYPTGTCAVIVTTHDGHKRSLCANLAAAEKFTIDHINEPENFEYIERARYFYTSGFFLIVSKETVKRIGEIAAKANKPLLLNLSASFVCDMFREYLVDIIPFTDIVFGNDAEALMFGEKCFGVTQISEIAKKIVNMPKVNKKLQRVVIITFGPAPVLYARDKEIQYINVPEIPKNKIIDTTGAGDAFVGGFLCQLLQGSTLEKCIKCGIWAAGHIIQRSGCTFDPDLKYPGQNKP